MTERHTEMPGSGLLDGLRQGRPEAYERVMAELEAPLYRFLLFSHGDHDAAEDQTGEVFVQLVRAVHQMRGGPESLRAFVFGIARNVLRRGWRRRPMLQASEPMLERLRDTAPPIHREVAARQELARVLEAIEQLEDPARQVMLLRFVEELSIAEVAAALDLPQGTIKSHIHRGRKRLRLLIESEEGATP